MVASGHLFIPIWTYFVALATGAAIVTPLGWLYAISNFQLPIGTTNELLYGVMVNAVTGHKNPVGATVYSSIAGDAWYRAQYMLQDQKIGHYMHIPPRATFFSQVFAASIGIPINYGVVRWVLNSKFDYLTGAVTDPSHQWTGQAIKSSLSTSVQYVLVVSSKITNFSRRECHLTKSTGPKSSLPRACLSRSPIWLRRRPVCTHGHLRTPSPLPPLTPEIPSLEYYHLLLRHDNLLGQHFDRKRFVYHWRLRYHVLGIPSSLRIVGQVQLHPGCSLRRWIQFELVVHLPVFWGGQDHHDAELVGE